jgi:multidrug efflux pump subunit AcrB
LAIAKGKGADAMAVSSRLIETVDRLKKEMVPSEVEITVTRNYGETLPKKYLNFCFTLSSPLSQ